MRTGLDFFATQLDPAWGGGESWGLESWGLDQFKFSYYTVFKILMTE